MLRPILLKSLLVLALLFTQLGGLMHGISHALAEQSQEQSLPHDQSCELCAGYAQLGNALGSTPLHFAVIAHSFTFQAAPVPAWRDAAFSAFAARAPPCSA